MSNVLTQSFKFSKFEPQFLLSTANIASVGVNLPCHC